MRTRSRAWRGPLGLGRLFEIQIRAERAHWAVVITVRGLTEEGVARRESVIQPSAGGVRERAGAIRIDPVALGELIHVELGHPLHRFADLIGDGAQPIFETLVVAHAPHTRRCLIAGWELGRAGQETEQSSRNLVGCLLGLVMSGMDR